MGWLGNLLGTNSLNHNFNYTPSTASYSPNNLMTQSVSNLNNAANTQMGIQRSMLATGRDLMSGRSPILDEQKQEMSHGLQAVASKQKSALNQQLAARGMGTGGLASLVSAGQDVGLAENVRKGYTDINKLGMGMGLQQMGLGLQAGGMGIGAMGQAGQLTSQMDQRALQAAMFNAQQRNEQQQYSRTSAYNQAAGNRAARGAFVGNLVGAASAMFNPAGAAAGIASGALGAASGGSSAASFASAQQNNPSSWFNTQNYGQ